MSGWVKLHKKIIDNDIFRHDRTAWHIFETLLILVNSKTGIWSGGLLQLVELTELKKTTLYDALDRLESEKMIKCQPNARYTTYLICNWKHYQQDSRTLTERPPNADRTLTERPPTLYKDIDIDIEDSTNVESAKPEDEISSLYYQVIKSLKLPILNHTTIKAKIGELKKEDTHERVVSYLKFMRDKYIDINIDFKPQINNALDIYSKRKQVENAMRQHVKDQSIQQVRFGVKK